MWLGIFGFIGWYVTKYIYCLDVERKVLLLLHSCIKLRAFSVVAISIFMFISIPTKKAINSRAHHCNSYYTDLPHLTLMPPMHCHVSDVTTFPFAVAIFNKDLAGGRCLWWSIAAVWCLHVNKQSGETILNLAGIWQWLPSLDIISMPSRCSTYPDTDLSLYTARHAL